MKREPLTGMMDMPTTSQKRPVSLSLTNEAITSVQETTIGPMAFDAK